MKKVIVCTAEKADDSDLSTWADEELPYDINEVGNVNMIITYKN